MMHILSPTYDPTFDRLGDSLHEIAVCSNKAAVEWKPDLVRNLSVAGIDAVWHDVSLADYRSLGRAFGPGDTVWILLDGIETDGYPGATVVAFIEELQAGLDLRVIGPRRRFYSQDKLEQKRRFVESRIDTPAWFLPEDETAVAACYRFLFREGAVPVIIKPYDLYCSIGIERDSVVDNERDALRVDARLRARTPRILVEQFIAGREFTVVCIGNGSGILVYPPVELVFHSAPAGMGFLDFRMTQLLHGDRSILEMATVADPVLAGRIEALARATFAAVGAESYVRIDIRLDTRTGLLYVLEVNPCPSVGVESSIEEILGLNGIPFDRFMRDLMRHGSYSGPAGAPEVDPRFFEGGKVRLHHDPGVGRCVRTTVAVRKGDPLFVAEIEAFGVEDAYKRNYCHRCLAFSERTYATACTGCGQVYYCSEACRALDVRHGPECEPLRRFHADCAEPVDSLSYYRVDIQVLARLFIGGERPLAALVAHFDKTDTARRMEAWRVASKLERLFDGRISLSNILATVCATDCNCFSGDHDPDGITLLSSRFAMMEHSCLPNAGRRREGDKVTLFALKDIPAGDPVAISYISALYHRSVRRQNLSEYYYFECGCPLCRSAGDEIPPEDLEALKDYYRSADCERLSRSSCYSFLSGRVVEHRTDADGAHPSFLKEFAHGRGLFAAEDLAADRCVERYSGRIMPYMQIPEGERVYALLLKKDEWLVADTAARYINHSCEPNCRIGPDREVRTVRPVRRGVELTISYDRLTRAEFLESPECFFWDPRWTFDCRCGSPSCVGRVDRYRIDG